MKPSKKVPWQDKWREVMQLSNEIACWETPWCPTTFADGSPMNDGNPIFSAVCQQRGIGIRIVQLEPTVDSSDELTFWVDSKTENKEPRIDELVIACSLTNNNLRMAMDLMLQWIRFKEIVLNPTSEKRFTG